ncbi:hypothetical protein K439DRAFT_551661 [Ramaria rubella]|nr:hypothetical protein K439DRAFT_551661 [Ramaria rubella]
MGYVGTSFTTFSTLPTTQDVTLVLFVTLPSVDPPGIFDMRAIGMPAPYLGVIDGYSGPLWGPGLAGYGSMTVVQESTFPASNVQNPTGLPSQSNIWTMDSTTGQLTSTWFNDDGTPVPCTMFYDLTYGDLNFGGDLSAFKATYWQDQDVQVWLYYIGLW